jgi:hypothetical protein
MGRSYIYECQKCGYRAIVSGRNDRGVNFAVTTIRCLDCRELRDAVTALRLSESEMQAKDNPSRPIKGRVLRENWNLKLPPSAEAVFNRLAVRDGSKYRWVHYAPRCSRSPVHRIEPWIDPGLCPKCGIHMEKGAMPYRLWD